MPTKPVLRSDTFVARTAFRAKRRAIRNWRGKVKDKYGRKWSYWFRAKEKERICWGPRKRAACYVQAKPYRR